LMPRVRECFFVQNNVKTHPKRPKLNGKTLQIARRPQFSILQNLRGKKHLLGPKTRVARQGVSLRGAAGWHARGGNGHVATKEAQAA
jgi:hypothetical protein